MTIFVLTFNKAAAAALGANTRLRVKPLKRGGTEFVALRPSYRVSGKNAMLRTTANDDGTVIAEMADELVAELALPQLRASNHQYEFSDVGYGWFILREAEENAKASTPLITVSKRRASAKKADTTEDEAAPAKAPEAETKPAPKAKAPAKPKTPKAEPAPAAAPAGEQAADETQVNETSEATATPETTGTAAWPFKVPAENADTAAKPAAKKTTAKPKATSKAPAKPKATKAPAAAPAEEAKEASN